MFHDIPLREGRGTTIVAYELIVEIEATVVVDELIVEIKKTKAIRRSRKRQWLPQISKVQQQVGTNIVAIRNNVVASDLVVNVCIVRSDRA